MTTVDGHEVLIPHLFRREYSKMTALLCRHFGLKNIALAEDIASDTFLRASEIWASNGVPENPVAWLYVVAKNKVLDYLRRKSNFESNVSQHVLQESYYDQFDDRDFEEKIIDDSILAMIFAVCTPAISEESQICLALQILCGFSVEEISEAFLISKESVKKRLLRARGMLRENNFQLSRLMPEEIRARKPTVLHTLYLLFNEGYYSSTYSISIRKDLCLESMRLLLVLLESKHTNCPQVQAMMALMCFQSSRFEARVGANGHAILYEDQDHSLWDQTLVDKGNLYLIEAFRGNARSQYHFEAAIAYWHTCPEHPDRWMYVTQLYEQLLQLKNAPMVTLNYLFAFSKLHGRLLAMQKLGEFPSLPKNVYFHSLVGYFNLESNPAEALLQFQEAFRKSKSEYERQSLQKDIDKLVGK